MLDLHCNGKPGAGKDSIVKKYCCAGVKTPGAAKCHIPIFCRLLYGCAFAGVIGDLGDVYEACVEQIFIKVET